MSPPRTPGPPVPSGPPRRARRFDPRVLDVAAFCRNSGELGGELALASLPRLASSLVQGDDAAPVPPLAWRARGVLRPAGVGEPQPWIELEARAPARLQCQRCLQPVDVALEVARPIRFVEGEDEAARLDEEGEDDVLALTHRLDLLGLLEDELILALPLVPRHERCPVPLPAAPMQDAGSGGDASAEERPNPFAALARLRKGG